MATITDFKGANATTVRSIDLYKMVGDNAILMMFRMGMPSFDRMMDEKALGLERSDEAETGKRIDAITRKRDVCIALPTARLKVFQMIRNQVRNSLERLSSDFPLLPNGVFMLGTYKPRYKPNEGKGLSFLDRAHKVVNEAYQAFCEQLDALIGDLPALRSKMRADYQDCAVAVFNERKNRFPAGTTFEEFHARYTRFFDKVFPTPEAIRRGFHFEFRSVGSIAKPITMMTRDEMLADAETAARMNVIEASEKALGEIAKDWLAMTASAVPVGLFRALQPVVEAIRKGESIGKREISKILGRIEEIKVRDILGNKPLAECIFTLENLMSGMGEKISKVDAEKAKIGVESAFSEVADSLRSLEFNPIDYRRLDLDSDDVQVIADMEIREEISERMLGGLAVAIQEMANAEGTTDEAKADALDRLATITGLKNRVLSGAYSEETAASALRASTLDLAD